MWMPSLIATQDNLECDRLFPRKVDRISFEVAIDFATEV
jgi:hypothetical protein